MCCTNEKNALKTEATLFFIIHLWCILFSGMRMSVCSKLIKKRLKFMC